MATSINECKGKYVSLIKIDYNEDFYVTCYFAYKVQRAEFYYQGEFSVRFIGKNSSWLDEQPQQSWDYQLYTVHPECLSSIQEDLNVLLPNIQEEYILQRELDTPFPIIETFKLINDSFSFDESSPVLFTLKNTPGIFYWKVSATPDFEWWLNPFELFYGKDEDNLKRLLIPETLSFYDSIMDQIIDHTKEALKKVPSLRLRVLNKDTRRYHFRFYEDIKAKKCKQ